MNKISPGLFLVGAAACLTSWGLFFRMAIELNKVLPPSKRIPLFPYRMYIPKSGVFTRSRFRAVRPQPFGSCLWWSPERFGQLRWP